MSNETGEDAIVRKLKSKTIKELLEILQKEVHPPGEEHKFILTSYETFIEDLSDQFMAGSGGGGVANLWRLVCLFECSTSPNNRQAFDQRHHQKTRYELDAKNLPILPPTYYNLVAEEYNSEMLVKSRIIPGWGPPL